jgi:AAA+ ATPase superfamily predicted ATPase
MFVDREQELAFLNSLLKQPRSPAQLVLLYGRRRVGKTVLARRWAEQAGRPTFYWAAERETAPLQRRKLFARILGVPMPQAPAFESWADLWTAFAAQIGDRPHILILDEVPHAAEADPAFLSALQHAWDQHFQHSKLFLLLSGSHVHTMETLLARGSPLFGRFTGQWHLQPLSFSALRHFLPRWPADQRVAAYALLGGVPAYLERLQPDASLTDNLRDVLLSPGSLFVAEPDLLLFDEVREPRVYRAILQAIGAGAHTLDEVANAALIGKSHLSAYLTRLQELRLVERRLPVTVPPGKRVASRMGRYHLADPFLRFFFRFIAPRQDEIGYQPGRVLADIQDQLRPFVATAFESLCREWVGRASQAGRLPFEAQQVGSHWGKRVQIDVVAINWREKAILLGECKWGTEAVSRDVVTELIEDKTPRVLKVLPEEGQGWTVHYALFARAGFTPAARALAQTRQAILVDLKQLDRDLE